MHTILLHAQWCSLIQLIFWVEPDPTCKVPISKVRSASSQTSGSMIVLGAPLKLLPITGYYICNVCSLQQLAWLVSLACVTVHVACFMLKVRLSYYSHAALQQQTLRLCNNITLWRNFISESGMPFWLYIGQSAMKFGDIWYNTCTEHTQCHNQTHTETQDHARLMQT